MKNAPVLQRLQRLREEMQAAGMDAYLVLSQDFHASEYVGEHFKFREYLSGFTGSAGTLVVLPEKAALWTDGRYFLQAEEQLQGSGIQLMRSGMPGVPRLEEFLTREILEGGTLGVDGRTISKKSADRIRAALSEKQIRLEEQRDLAEAVWEGRPSLPSAAVWELGVEYAGQSREEKLVLLRQKMKEADAQLLVLTALDEIAWCLNLRGNDVECTPVVLAYLLLGQEDALLCIDAEKLPAELRKKLAACGIELRPYGEVYKLLRETSARRILLDGTSANDCVFQSLDPAAAAENVPSPVIKLKAVKNAVEQENIRKAHEKDGTALCRFIYWLKSNVGKELVTECSAAAQLECFRQEEKEYLGPSFAPIVAYGAHGAIVHYSATEETDAPLRAEGFCLADTGGHYLNGTTDVTRTIALGPLTQEEKRVYTLVLKGNLRLGGVKFPQGCCGANLDVLARGALWEHGMDYNHGTGHGVGYLLSVHEGPQSIQWHLGPGGKEPLLPGMVLSNEPGFYIKDRFGVRLENLLLVRRAEDIPEGHFLNFETMTLAPFEREAILTELLNAEELALLNAYHARVLQVIGPRLAPKEREWLQWAAAPLK